ncbi:hypothetical protein K474DRAFT_1775748 [Panus rudis PR-1116 ss-1]|nr:hypothetical protein K474DRAFT_1775748 [Panus rudis PR-1116 ss-1]
MLASNIRRLAPSLSVNRVLRQPSSRAASLRTYSRDVRYTGTRGLQPYSTSASTTDAEQPASIPNVEVPQSQTLEIPVGERNKKEAIIPTLPPLPSKPPYPCPHLTQAGVAELLTPLYHRRWTITRVVLKEQSKEKPNQEVKHPLALTKTFEFQGFNAAANFFQNVLTRIVRSENHHPKITIDGSVVTVELHTHSAVPSTSESTPVKPFPGVTARDVRFAILLEQSLVNEDGQPSSIGLSLKEGTWEPTIAIDRKFQPISLDRVKQKWRRVKRNKCLACGGEHKIAECTTRQQFEPFRPCKLCGGKHWIFDCEQYVPGVVEEEGDRGTESSAADGSQSWKPIL